LHIDPERKAQIKEIRLFQSWNKGKTWERIATVKPDQASITVKTSRDGEVWFTLQIFDQNGLPDVVDLSKSVSLKVRIDTEGAARKDKE
jgi:hypothetical protein